MLSQGRPDAGRERTIHESAQQATADRACHVGRPQCNPIRYSKRIFEIAAPLPIKKATRPKRTKGKSGRRNNAKQPQHDDDAAIHSTPDSESTPLPTTVESTPEIASVPPQSTNAAGGRPKTRRAQGIKPRPPAKHTEPIETLQKEPVEQGNHGTDQKPKRIRSEAYKKAKREKQAALRAERLALGLCGECGKPRPEGQTRCHDCVIRHSQYWKNYVAKGGRPKRTS